MNSYFEKTFSATNFLSETENSLTLIAKNILASNQIFLEHRTELEEVLLSNYVREVWIGESAPPKDLNTIEIVDLLLEGMDKPDKLDDKYWTKLKNLLTAVNFVISIFEGEVHSHEFFCVDFAKQIHRYIGSNLIPNCGEYRTKKMMASGSNVIYATPDTIHERLIGLFHFILKHVRDAPSESIARCLHMIRLGSVFFSEFLLIHPFSNGNGRTARLLLNAFLRFDVVIPFSMYIVKREEYIEVLEKRNNLSPPSALAQYVLLTCNRTAAQVNWLTMRCSEQIAPEKVCVASSSTDPKV